MKKVLIIANPYKPMNTIGTKRITAFLKYMDGSDWEPIVIAPKVKGAKEYDAQQPFKTIRLFIPGPTYIFRLAAKLFPKRKNVKVRESQTNEPDRNIKKSYVPKARSASLIRWLFIPDEYIFWGYYAAAVGVRYAKKYKVDLCFASGPAYSTLLAGAYVSKLSKIDLISDFRDPWVDSEFFDFKTDYHLKRHRRLEKRVIEQSKRILTVSPHMKHLFLNRYEKYKDKFYVLYNGYDPKDIKSPKVNREKKAERDSIVISHTGTFYGEKNPASFLEGLKLAKERKHDLNIQVKFVGGVDKIYYDYAINHQLDIVDVGKVSYEESIEHQQNSDILLLIPGPGKGTITGKFAEYLSAKKPIFCIGIPDSDLDQLLKETDAGVLADAKSPEDIADKIIFLYENLVENKNPFKFNNLEEFDFEKITQKLIAHFNEVKGNVDQSKMLKEENN